MYKSREVAEYIVVQPLLYMCRYRQYLVLRLNCKYNY